MTSVTTISKIASDTIDPIIRDVEPNQATQNMLAKVRKGKRIQEFSVNDWIEVFGVSEEEIVWDKVEAKLCVSFSHEENAADIANSLTASMKNVKDLYNCFANGQMSEVDFLYESEWACLDAVVDILVSYLRLCPIDIKCLGMVITDETLKLRYSVIKDDIRGEWAETLARHEKEQRAQNKLLEKRYRDYIEWLEKDLGTYQEILPRAFSNDPEVALAGSAELAAFLKLPQAHILSTVSDIDDFFLS